MLLPLFLVLLGGLSGPVPEGVGGLEGHGKLRPQLSARLALQDAMTGNTSIVAQMGGRASVGPRLTGKVRIYPE